MYIQQVYHNYFFLFIIIPFDFVLSHPFTDVNINKFLMQQSNRILPQCQLSNCKKCPNDQTCEECEKDFAFVEKECIPYDIIPSNKFVDLCDEYNSNYSCIKCKSDCSLKGNKCKCTLDVKIILIIVLCFGFLILLTFIITVCFVKSQKKKKNEISTETNKSMVVHNTKENLLINNNRLCSKCKKEKAIYFLSCGCLICENDIGKLKCFKEGDNFKCDCCKKQIENVTRIQNRCKLCSGSKNLLYLNNKITFEICSDCYEKYVKNKKIELKEQLSRNTSNQTTNETR